MFENKLTEKLAATFDKHDDEFLQFDRIAEKKSQRPDLHAFLLIDAVFTRGQDMVAYAEHDKIWLDIDGERLAGKLTDDLARDLMRCGVCYDEDDDCLIMHK